MLQYETARKIYEEMKEKVANNTKAGFKDFYALFLKNAADYAAARTSWAYMDQAARTEDDKRRRVKHDAFISILGAISRNLDMAYIEEVMPDRKTKGDFACYIALFLALEER